MARLRAMRSAILRGVLTATVFAVTSLTAQQPAVEDEAPDALYRNGLAHFTGGRYAEAAGYFQRLISVFGSEPELQKDLETVYYALGCSLYNQGLYEETITTFGTFLTKYPEAKFRDEAAFRMAAASQALEDYPKAIDAFQKVVAEWPGSPFAEDAAYQVAQCYIAQDRSVDAVKTLEEFVVAYPDSDLFAQAKVFLARAYFQSGKITEALAALESVQNMTRSLDHLVYANFLAIEIGDAAFDNTEYEQALSAYRRVRTKDSMIRLQQRLIGRMENELAYMAAVKVDPSMLAERFRAERRMKASLGATKDSLAKLEGMPDYDAGLFHRIGRCFFAVDRYWEARVAFTRVVAEATEPSIKEAGQFDLVLVLNRLRRFDEVVVAADAYLAAYGEDEKLIKNARVPAVGFMRAEAFVNRELFEEAEKEMKALAAKFPQHAQRARIDFYIALSIAMQERFGESIALFEKWLQDYPANIAVTEVEYWLPVAQFYDGQYAKALPQFIDYAQKYPESIYAPEAAYRAAMCKYSLEDFRGAALDLAAWLGRYPDHSFKWEALVTQGDALSAAGMLDEARKTYLKLTPEAGSFHFLGMQQLVKVYKALETEKDFAEMANVFSEFIRQNPDSPHVIEAAYNAGWALRQIKRTNEARMLYWSVIERFGNNRNWEGFGPLLKDVKGLYGDQPEGSFDAAVKQAEEKARSGGRVTLISRLVLAGFQWQKRDSFEGAQELIRRFNVEALDAEALAYVGESLVRGGDPQKGMEYLDILLKTFPKSRYLDVAYARKAEALRASGKAEEGLAMVNLAIEKAYESSTLLDAIFTRAQCLQALNRYDDAISDFNTLLANRATPRMVKPQAMLGIAACLESKGDVKKAIPYYQRIYVLYKAYTEPLAQAYLRSGSAFEKIQDREAAANTYKEMLAVESLSGRPELEEARARLAKLGS